MTVIFGFITFYYALTLLWYWAPLLALRTMSSGGRGRPQPSIPHPPPLLAVVAPCRGGSASIPGMAAALRNQDYPRDRYRLIFVIDTEHAADPSPLAAQAEGAEVFERRNPAIKTKGNAVNELLDKKLKHEPWDALAVLDIDVRAAPDFLAQVAGYLREGAEVIQAAIVSKNPDDNAITQISHAGQLLSQLIQRGRALMGLSAILAGSGMVFTRQSLMRLKWQTSTGRRLSDDGELNLRLALLGIPVTYGESLRLRNDVPSDIQSVRLQRKRWFAAHSEARSYIGPLLREGLSGRWRAWESLFTFIFLPGCSLSFVLGGLLAVALDLAGFYDSRLHGWGVATTVLWLLHGLYYILALRLVKGGLRWQDMMHLPGFLITRLIAIFQGAVLGVRTNPGQYSIPSDHTERMTP